MDTWNDSLRGPQRIAMVELIKVGQRNMGVLFRFVLLWF